MAITRQVNATSTTLHTTAAVPRFRLSNALFPRNTGDKLRSSEVCSGFVSFIDEMDSSPDSIGIDVPESVLVEGKEEPIHAERYSRRGRHRKGESSRSASSDRPGRVRAAREAARATSSWSSSPSCLRRPW